MKKIALWMALSALAIACDNNRNDEDRNPPPEPSPEPVKEPEPNGTTIRINEHGATYESKEGEKKSSVSVGGDTASVEIRK